MNHHQKACRVEKDHLLLLSGLKLVFAHFLILRDATPGPDYSDYIVSSA